MDLGGLAWIFFFLVTGCQGREQKRVIGGIAAKSSSYPGVVSLQLAHSNTHFCGGGIIAPKVVLTAGHCVHPFRPKDVLVYAGSRDVLKGGVLYEVAKLIPHPKYKSFTNDIGLVITKVPINTQGKGKDILALPTSSHYYSLGTPLTALGWGLLKHPAGTLSKKLQKLTMEVSECRSPPERREMVAAPDGTILCVGGTKGIGLCKGDSGTPVISGDNTIVALVSTGFPCALGYPDQLTNVHTFLPWIKAATKSLRKKVHKKKYLP